MLLPLLLLLRCCPHLGSSLTRPPSRPALPPASFHSPCSFEQLVARIDELLTVGEDATEALQPPPLHMGPCKAAAIGCQMAAAAAAVAPEVGTPPQNHT